MNNQRLPRLNQLSGAAGRKRAKIRKENESKNKRTLLDCVRWTKNEDKPKQVVKLFLNLVKFIKGKLK